MKKTLLIGSALVICFAGFSQSNAKKVVNPKITKTTLAHKRVTAEGLNSHSNINWRPTVFSKTASTGCLTNMHVSDSWNPNGVGASEDAMAQNCLVYNKDLNTIAWIMRGSCDWTAAFPTSGGYEASIISNVAASSTNTVTNVQDSVALWRDVAANNYGGRYPGGSWLNPPTTLGGSTPNTNWHNAYACVIGPYNAQATGNWRGALYVPKPLWSQSAVNHTAPTSDSLFCVSGTTPFGPSPIGGSPVWFGAPNTDGQQVGNTMWSTGSLLNLAYSGSTTAPWQQMKCGLISKATISSTTPGLVNWTIDSMSLRPNFYTGTVGYLNAGNPRLAFGLDGQTGYAVFLGRLATNYNNSADSAMTPILYKTTDGGTTWTQLLAGYDWMCKHPEVDKNVGMGVLAANHRGFYSFSSGYSGVDLTVDANNVLHFVCTVNEPVKTIDSIAVYSYTYDYDNVNYHPIIWDFMTDGTDWTTMMVDSCKVVSVMVQEQIQLQHFLLGQVVLIF